MARLIAAWLAVWLPGLIAARAQPPGTPPPDQILTDDQSENPDELPIRAFMFLSESGNRVMMPALSWEEFERFLNLDTGMETAPQNYVYQSLEISGTSDSDRAELDVTLRFTIESTEGRWISIPLRMGNFHRLAPPEVNGVDEHFMALSPDDTGYLLFVKTEQRSDAMLQMRVSARVDASAAARGLSFRLPDVPVRVDLTTTDDDTMAEVIGRGDETITVAPADGGGTGISVESSGGSFLVRWGQLERTTDNVPVLEVESRSVVGWDSPQDQPVATIRLTVRNIRGSIDGFQLRLPSGSVVLGSPRLGASGQTIDLESVVDDGSGEVRDVIIPEDERQQRIDLNFELQLANDNATAASPLNFRVPEVVGALRHRGEIEINTGGDYRLRWRATPWIRSELGETRDDAASGRSYRFRFDRASFSLPLWLGEKERRLRMISRAEITVREQVASIVMDIEVGGQTADGRLRFNDGGWQVRSIESETGQSLDSFTEDGLRVIELIAGVTEESTKLQVRAQRSLMMDDGQVEFAIPRVVAPDDTALVQDATIDLINTGRTVLVVDLDASKGINRIARSTTTSTEDSTITSFRILAQGPQPLIVGNMIEQPPRVVLASDATIELDGQQLRTTVDWNISSALDLEGRLPIRIPPLPTAFPTDPGLTGSTFAEDLETGRLGTSSEIVNAETSLDGNWVVTVDNVPAQLEPLEEGRFVLISQRLTTGSMGIRWRYVRDLRSSTAEGSVEPVALPRPDFADVTVRGPMRITLQGNQQLDLVAMDSPTQTDLELGQLPRDPIRLRLRSRLTAKEELSIRRTILRTVVGRTTRHEQVLATIQGGDSFRVGLPEETGEVSVQALIDGKSEPVRRDGNTLVLSLPGDSVDHVVDLRVWLTMSSPTSIASVEPALRLPVGVGRIYWQIVAPLDGHIVWASPTLGRSMTWRFDRWRLFREPSYDDQDLTQLAGATDNPLPPGNRYLYVGSDLRSFRAIVVSRVVLWLCIGALVLVSAVVLNQFPRSRHPLTAVLASVLFGGLLAIAPDAAVLAGQFGMIAIVLVIVMFAVRSLLSTSSGDRVFPTTTGIGRSNQPSTRSLKKEAALEPVSVQASTQPMSPSAPEASP